MARMTWPEFVAFVNKKLMEEGVEPDKIKIGYIDISYPLADVDIKIKKDGYHKSGELFIT